MTPHGDWHIVVTGTCTHQLAYFFLVMTGYLMQKLIGAEGGI